MAGYMAALTMGVASAAAPAASPTVVELFTAQGCPACPAADAAMAGLVRRPDVIALSFSVTYWDGRGWRDPLAQPAFTRRQRRYAAIGRREAATPQFVIDRRYATSESDPTALGRAIGAAGRVGGPAIGRHGARLAIGADPRTARAATVWLADYEPQPIRTGIAAGPTSGRTAVQYHVVRRLVAIGGWNGAALSLPLPPRAAGLRRVAIVQSADGGAIVAAARLE